MVIICSHSDSRISLPPPHTHNSLLHSGGCGHYYYVDSKQTNRLCSSYAQAVIIGLIKKSDFCLTRQ